VDVGENVRWLDRELTYREVRLEHREAAPIIGKLWAFRWDDDIYFVKVGFWKKLKLKLFGRVYIGHIERPEWRAPLPIYLLKCGEHGYYVDYPHGYTQYFECPRCLQETKAELRRR